ncbi:MAG: hypothetical protein M1838_001926 [Thelocarpon superellum]|nr:MAG: hypothetical protein M1838_001926 [Thelocarpon superellum]
MLTTLEAIFRRAEEAGTDLGLGERHALTGYGSTAPGAPRRSDAMKDVKRIMDQLWQSRSVFLPRASEALADGSRDPDWRGPCGESGVLDLFFVMLATPGLPHEQMVHSLRLVGNCCAENDENRSRVVTQDHLPSIIKQLDDPSLVYVAIPVLYNICFDYEPAQKNAAEKGLVPRLMTLLSDEGCAARTDKALLGYTCRVLELVVASPPGVAQSPDSAAETLLQLALDVDGDLDDMVALINAAIVHLATVRFQQHLLANQSLKLALRSLVKSYSRPSTPDVKDYSATDLTNLPPSDQPLSAEEELLLGATRNQLVQALSDVSALPDFGRVYPLDSPLVGSLRMWLSVPQAQLQVCACVMLGNLARSDEACRVMVHEFHIQHALIELLRNSDDGRVIHAVTSFLKNLALSPANKDLLGQAGLIEVLSRLWSMDTLPQGQYAGASLARQVVSGSYENIQRLLTPLSPDPDSPAHARTYLSLLLLLCDKSDQWPTKTEVARTLAAMCRLLHSSQLDAPRDEVQGVLHRLYALHPDVARPIVTAACYSKWAPIRSEGWFACALMASTKEGAGPVNEAMSLMDTLRPLVEVVTGKSVSGTPAGEHPPSEIPAAEQAGSAEMKQVDRENALILVSNLLKHQGDEMPDMPRQVLEDLLHGHAVSSMPSAALLPSDGGSFFLINRSGVPKNGTPIATSSAVIPLIISFDA